MIHDILQTKERLIRKQFHSRSSTEIGIIPDVRAFSSANQRSEFPNRFKIKVTELDNLESVITQYAAPKFARPQSSKVRLMSQALLDRGKRAATPPPFYYTDRNEILGFEQFFKVHKALHYRRKNLEKVNDEEQTEEKRKKLKEMRIMSAHTRARSKNSNTQASLIVSQSPMQMSNRNRPGNIRAESAAKTINSCELDGNSSMSLKKLFAKDNTISETGLGTTNDDISQRISTGSKVEKLRILPNELCDVLPINVENDYLVSYEGQETSSQQKDALNIKEQSQDHALQLIHQDSKRSQTGTQNRYCEGDAGFFRFTEPKLTRKQVYKHLQNYTVTPKKLKPDAKSIEIEKYYTRVYRNAKVMDKEVETNLQRLKTKTLLRNVGTLGVSTTQESPIRLRNISCSRDRVVRATHEHLGKSVNAFQALESMMVTTKEQDQEKHAGIAENISQGIKDINEVLNENLIIKKNINTDYKPRGYRRQLGKEVGDNLLKQLLANRTPSRKMITEKYHIPTFVQRNLELNERAHQIKSVVLKQAEEEKTLVSYSSAEHVGYYIS